MAVVQRFENMFPGARAIVPMKSRYRRTQTGAIEERVILLPGYVFFEVSQPPEPSRDADSFQYAIRDFSRSDGVLKLLRYNDGDWQLHGADDRFAQMLLDADGNIGISRAYFDENRRIRILNGFLKDYEGSIVRVNHKMKTVEVVVDFQDKKVTMKLGYEMVTAI
jgi:transcription antitermination factor NusG